MKVFAAVLVLLCGLAAALPSAEAASGERIEHAAAEVTAAGNLPPLVRQRMEESVQAIAGQLLEGQTVDGLSAEKAQKEQLIHEIFDKVLVGYTVRQVTIFPAAEAKVQVELLPWSETIRQVQVETSVEGMPPRIEKLVRQDLQDVARVFCDALTGLPVAASDWTNGVVKHALNAYMAGHLPEFRADFELDPEPAAKVRVTVYPRLPVVRTVDLSMRSDTVPNFYLLVHRELMQDLADELSGVPVAFVERHEAELSAQFAEELDRQPDFRAFRIKTRTVMNTAERLGIMTRSDTDRYRLRLTGWLDVGRSRTSRHEEGRNLVFRLHAGRMISRIDELFWLADFMPQSVAWGGAAGYDRRFGSRFHAQVRYDLGAQDFVLAASQQLAPRWLLRGEYRFAEKNGETALRYKLHDFLSMEYLIDRDQNWLRLIGNF